MSFVRAAQYPPRSVVLPAAGYGNPAAADVPHPPSVAAYIGESARRAMLGELHATPKPGLVDRRDCGSHRDMSLDTLSSSAAAIHPFLERVALHASGAPAEAVTLSAARRIGLEAEDAMFSATRGVNTHKGQIFVLVTLICGVVCRSGALSASEESRDCMIDSWRGAVRSLTSGVVERELACLDAERAVSHGERLYVTHGLTGIRGEAQNGFPAVFRIGLPMYRTMLREEYTADDAAVHALLAIMTVAEDTTVVHRGGIEALEFVRSSAAEAMARGGMRTVAGRSCVDRMNTAFIDRGLSPGGCADLLAGTIFVHTVAEALSDRHI